MRNLSRLLTKVLRHEAEKDGISISEDGFVEIGDLLAHRRFHEVTRDEIVSAVSTNEKQRFEISGDRIRAVQGHSIAKVTTAGARILGLQDGRYEAIHATLWETVPLIQAAGGLSRMSRNHVHMVFPEDLERLARRRSCKITVNLRLLIEDGFLVLQARNGVVLCSGNEEGFIPLRYLTIPSLEPT